MSILVVLNKKTQVVYLRQGVDDRSRFRADYQPAITMHSTYVLCGDARDYRPRGAHAAEDVNGANVCRC